MAKLAWTADRQLQTAAQWASCRASSQKLAQAQSIAQHLSAHRPRYEAVQSATGVPWWFVAALHYRESAGDFNTYLGDGEPLDHVTHNVPKGRGPFKDFEAGALDALTHEKFDKITDWSIPHALYLAEVWNGAGYSLHGVPSPYVWSWTNNYAIGKYSSDGHYDPELIDKQPGVAIMWQALASIFGPMILNQVLPAVAGAPSAPIQVPTAGSGAGVTVTQTTTLTNFIGVALGAVLASMGISGGVGADALHLVASVGGVILAFSALINHLHVTGNSNANTLNTMGTLLTQVGSYSAQIQAAQPTPIVQPAPAAATSTTSAT